MIKNAPFEDRPGTLVFDDPPGRRSYHVSAYLQKPRHAYLGSFSECRPNVDRSAYGRFSKTSLSFGNPVGNTGLLFLFLFYPVEELTEVFLLPVRSQPPHKRFFSIDLFATFSFKDLALRTTIR